MVKIKRCSFFAPQCRFIYLSIKIHHTIYSSNSHRICTYVFVILSTFTARRNACGLGCRNSVRSPDAFVIKRKNILPMFWYHMKVNLSSFLTTTVVDIQLSLPIHLKFEPTVTYPFHFQKKPTSTDFRFPLVMPYYRPHAFRRTTDEVRKLTKSTSAQCCSITSLLYTEAELLHIAYCDRLQSVFVNNSGVPEPISMKFYLVTTDGDKKFWATSVESGQNGPEKANFFVMETMPPKCHFSAADLCEIWIQYMNWCHYQSLLERIAKFFFSGSFTPKLTFWAVFQWVSCYQTVSQFPLSFVVNGRGLVTLYTSYRSGDILRWRYRTFIQLGFVYCFAP